MERINVIKQDIIDSVNQYTQSVIKMSNEVYNKTNEITTRVIDNSEKCLTIVKYTGNTSINGIKNITDTTLVIGSKVIDNTQTGLTLIKELSPVITRYAINRVTTVTNNVFNIVKEESPKIIKSAKSTLHSIEENSKISLNYARNVLNNRRGKSKLTNVLNDTVAKGTKPLLPVMIVKVQKGKRKDLRHKKTLFIGDNGKRYYNLRVNKRKGSNKNDLVINAI